MVRLRCKLFFLHFFFVPDSGAPVSKKKRSEKCLLQIYIGEGEENGCGYPGCLAHVSEGKKASEGKGEKWKNPESLAGRKVDGARERLRRCDRRWTLAGAMIIVVVEEIEIVKLKLC